MTQRISPEFEQRPDEEEVFWLQDVKADVTPQVISPGCFVTARYRGVTVTIRVDALEGGGGLSGVITGFDSRSGGHPKGIHVGDAVRLSVAQVFSCGCAEVS